MRRLLQLILRYAAAPAVLLLIQMLLVHAESTAWFGFMALLLGWFLTGTLLNALMIHIGILAFRRQLPRWAIAIPLSFYIAGFVLFLLGQRDVAELEAQMAARISVHPTIDAIVLPGQLEFYARSTSERTHAKNFRQPDPPLSLYSGGFVLGPEWIGAKPRTFDQLAGVAHNKTYRLDFRDGETCRSAAIDADVSDNGAEKTPNGQCVLKVPAELPKAYFLIVRSWYETLTFNRTLATALVQPIHLYAIENQSADLAALVYAGEIDFVPPIIFPIIGCVGDTGLGKGGCVATLFHVYKSYGPNRYGAFSELLDGLTDTLAKVRGLSPK
jgi:hypothetical protein